MPLEFYYHPFSPPCRAVMLKAKAVGVELTLKKIDLLAGETRTPEFLAINPQHTLPTLVDGNIKLWESRAICTYLASQYGKDDSFYPNNPKARCMVDARLYFDMGTLVARMGDYIGPVFRGDGAPDPKKLEKLHEALGWFNTFLADYTFAAGNKVTVADHSIVAYISTMVEAGIELDTHGRVEKWLNRCKTAMKGYEEVNGEGARMVGKFVKAKLEEAPGVKPQT